MLTGICGAEILTSIKIILVYHLFPLQIFIQKSKCCCSKTVISSTSTVLDSDPPTEITRKSSTRIHRHREMREFDWSDRESSRLTEEANRKPRLGATQNLFSQRHAIVFGGSSDFPISTFFHRVVDTVFSSCHEELLSDWGVCVEKQKPHQ